MFAFIIFLVLYKYSICFVYYSNDLISDIGINGSQQTTLINNDYSCFNQSNCVSILKLVSAKPADKVIGHINPEILQCNLFYSSLLFGFI